MSTESYYLKAVYETDMDQLWSAPAAGRRNGEKYKVGLIREMQMKNKPNGVQSEFICCHSRVTPKVNSTATDALTTS